MFTGTFDFQIDAAADSEKMIESLTEKNMDLEKKLRFA